MVTDPNVNIGVPGATDTAITAPLAALTVTVLVPETEPLLTDVAVIVAVPAATAVTKPLEFTVATPVLLLAQVTLGFVAFDGIITDAS